MRCHLVSFGTVSRMQSVTQLPAQTIAAGQLML
jgi:hypothetical protein